MVMPYHLHMPSYFLETFTEYPSVKLIIRFRRFGFTNPFSGWLGLVASFGLYAGMVTRLHNIHISSSGL